jgi:hypothetical protein
MSANPADTRHAEMRELLIKDLELFEASIWRNEETGEKRFNFFITLVTTVIGGLAVLWASKELKADHATLKQITWQASLALMVFGLLSFRRMMHRDRVTAEYKKTTRYIRNMYRDSFAGTHPLFNQYQVPRERPKESALRARLRRIFQGGYTPSLALMNGFLLTVALIAADEISEAASVGWGVALAVLLCVLGSVSPKR